MCSPAECFADILEDANARLGADADRYSFIVVDFHHLLPADFYRRTGLLDFCRGLRPSLLGRFLYRSWISALWDQQYKGDAANNGCSESVIEHGNMADLIPE
jgi:hypothetical protein